MKPLGIGAVAAVLFVALTGVIYWLQGAHQLMQPGKVFTHTHCPECRLEMTYSPALDGKHCPQCGGSGPVLVPTVGPSRQALGSLEMGPAGKLTVAGFVALLVTIAFVYGASLRYRARLQIEAQAENRMLVCRCPFCNRRIGYPAKNRGAATLCPRCKTAFSLTEGEERDDARDSRS